MSTIKRIRITVANSDNIYKIWWNNHPTNPSLEVMFNSLRKYIYHDFFLDDLLDFLDDCGNYQSVTASFNKYKKQFRFEEITKHG